MRVVSFCLVALSASLVACGSKDAAEAKVDLLDPTAVQYGKSYAEWAADWVRYIFQEAPPDCVDPLQDFSGEECTRYQNPESPVFFLVGTSGGVARRDACTPPADKALFFPLVNSWSDNAGVPDDQVLSEASVKSIAEAVFDSYDIERVHLRVDGQALPRLERGGVRSARYTLSLPEGKNPYNCMGLEVSGDFVGYATGYWAMLAPLPAGPHTLDFGGTIPGGTPNAEVTVDVTYTFR